MISEAAASVAAAAAARRHELSQQWLRASQAGALMGEPPNTAEERAARERRAGRILGVWVPSERSYRYPPWQFRSDGTPEPRLRDILGLLREHDGVIGSGQRTSGWSEAAWFLALNTLLGARAPFELLMADPDRLLAMAREQFTVDAGGW